MGSNAVSVLSLLLVLGTSTVVADVIPISITRQVATNGSVLLCGGSLGCVTSASFSASDTSQALGPYDVTKTGSGGVPFSEISGSAQQISNITSDQITIDMNTSAGLVGVEVPANVDSDASSGFSFLFAVDALSQVHIFGSASLDSAIGLTTFPVPTASGGGTQSITLTGPGVDFVPSIPALGGSFSQSQTVPFDSMFTLAAGQYMLDVNTDANISYGGQGIGSAGASSGLSLTADFREIPEPSLVPFLLFSVAVVIWRQRTYARKPS